MTLKRQNAKSEGEVNTKNKKIVTKFDIKSIKYGVDNAQCDFLTQPKGHSPSALPRVVLYTHYFNSAKFIAALFNVVELMRSVHSCVCIECVASLMQNRANMARNVVVGAVLRRFYAPFVHAACVCWQ